MYTKKEGLFFGDVEAHKGESFSFHNKGEKKKRRDGLRRDYGKRQEGRGDERKEAGVKERWEEEEEERQRGNKLMGVWCCYILTANLVGHTPVYILTLWF